MAQSSELEKQLPTKDHNGRHVHSTSYTNTLDTSPSPQVPSASLEDMYYPEGGLQAWLVVLGSFSGMAASFGLLNTVGTLQAYLSTHQLANYDPATVGWIFSIYLAVTFFCGILIGPMFDAKGPRWLIASGSILLVGGIFATAEARGQSSFKPGFPSLIAKDIKSTGISCFPFRSSQVWGLR